MELRVEHAPLHKFFSNETLWYKLPRRREMARLFLTARETRISADYSICAQMGTEGSFELTIPDDATVLLTALGAGMQTHYNEALAVEHKQPKYQHIQLSDKGGYNSGVLSLFGGLQAAGHFFESGYCRDVAERLASRGTSNDDRVLQTIRNKISKHAATIAEQLGNNRQQGIACLARWVLNTAREQHMLDEDISFPELNELFQEQRERFIASHPDFRKDHSESAVKAEQNAVANDLLRTLQSLTENRIFLQGVRLSCRNCGTNYWEDLGNVEQANTCHGCGAPVPMPAEARWRYRLNSLIRNSVAFHGLIPVILSLHNLRSLARTSFFFAPGLAFYGHYEDRRPVAELDIACISDGKLVVGEVKTSTVEFTSGELAKLAALAQSLGADVAIIAAYLGPENQMGAKKAELEQILRGTSILTQAILPHSYVFEPRPHP